MIKQYVPKPFSSPSCRYFSSLLSHPTRTLTQYLPSTPSLASFSPFLSYTDPTLRRTFFLGVPSFTLGPREIGFGLGIHGEPGIDKKYPEGLQADEIVRNILSIVLKYVDVSDGIFLANSVPCLSFPNSYSFSFICRCGGVVK